MAASLGLTGKTVVVTGASRGIGRATAGVLADHGARLVVMGRTDSAALRSVTAELGRRTDVLPMACDNSRPEEITQAYRRIRAEVGRVDVLVNNAGVMEDALIGMIPAELISRVLAVNTVGPILHMQSAARLMGGAGGSIINLASIVGLAGSAGSVVYSASKAAVIGMTLSAAKELAPHGIRVNAVAPGFIATDMTRGLPSRVRDRSLASIGLGREGLPDDVAHTILFLASDLSTYVTGQVLGVDGGMIM